MSLTRVFVGLGSNLGNRSANMRRALNLLGERVSIVSRSPLYETAPVGYTEQGAFLNAAIEIVTDLPADAILDILRDVENALGKATPFENGPRTMDLDLLLYGENIINEPGLRVPHPRMHERRFVLVPLVDIAGGTKHPSLRKSVLELLNDLPPAQVELSGERWETPA